MIVIAAIALGIFIGRLRAIRAKGDSKDIWQWAIAHAMAFGLIGLFLTIFIDRMI